jgi:hypothetical protein
MVEILKMKVENGLLIDLKIRIFLNIPYTTLYAKKGEKLLVFA